MPSPEELDAWMCQAQQEDDADAFARLIDATQHMVRAVILRDCADAELADELAQETMVRAWTKRDQYRAGTSPRAWMLAIARSQLMDYHRRQDRNRRHLRELIREELLRRAPEDLDEDQERRLAVLQSCIAELRSEQQELLDLIHNQGLSTDDTAEILGIKGPACRQRLSRLQRLLRDCAETKLGTSSHD